ncbi:MAG: hypothetical protein ACI9YL_001426 [Luteibaculaceae bacterium]|jgi:hypothetical protein
MDLLRQLIRATVPEIEGVNSLEETLKWGEPSYLTKYGSTLRMPRLFEVSRLEILNK